MKNLLSFILIGISFSTQAQKKDIYFLKNDGTEVSIKDSSDFIRVIQEPDSGKVNFKLREYYPDNSVKFIGEASSTSTGLVLQGQTISYSPKGKRTDQITYKNGIPAGNAYYYYPNGRVQKVIEYFDDPAGKLDQKLNAYFDSLGNQTVNEGSGHAIIETQNQNEILIEEGNFKQGFKDSSWTGHYTPSKRIYHENYTDGKLISGIQILENGKEVSYKQINEPAEFKGGKKELYRYLAQNFRIPADVRLKKLAGKFYFTFEINTDGTLTLLEVAPFMSSSVNTEVERLLAKSPKWIPARNRGIPYKSTRTESSSIKISEGVTTQPASARKNTRFN